MEASSSTLERMGDFVATAPVSLSDQCYHTVRNSVVDVFGCILGGARTSVARATVKAMQSLGGVQGMVRVFGTGLHAPSHTAAMLNAVAGHALEFDDWEIPGNTHPSVVLLPALMAVLDRGVGGDALLQAYVMGFAVIARLGEALNFTHYQRGWHATATLGALGAAAVTARLQRLSRSQTTHALSIAISRASGLTCQFGADTKALQAGFAAEAGVVASTLARNGVTGRLDALEHERGMAALMSDVPPMQVVSVLKNLGSPFAVEQYGILIKPWPSCGYTHRIMACALELRHMKIDADDIVGIALHLPDFHAAILPFHRPQNRREAVFSLPFVAAMGLVYGNLTLADLAQEIWQQETIQRLLDCTSVHAFCPSRPTLNYDPLEPDRMQVTLKDGACREAICSLPPGTPEAPLSDRRLLDKFRDNAGNGPEEELDALLDWPSHPNVHRLFERFGMGIPSVQES